MEEDLGYLDASYMILKGKDRMPRSYFCCPVNVLHPVLVTTRQDDLFIETERPAIRSQPTSRGHTA